MTEPADLPVFTQSPRDDAFIQDPFPAYDQLRGLGRLVWWEDYGIAMTGHYDLVSALLRDRRFGREVTHVRSRAELGWPDLPEHVRPFYDFEGNSLLEREPPVHTRLRGLVNRAFVSRAVEKLRPRIDALANTLIDGFEGEGTVDLLERFATPIPVIVIAELLGLPAGDVGLMLDWSHRMVAMYEFGRTRAIEDEAVAATHEFSAYMRDRIAAKRSDLSDDLLSALIGARDHGDRLSDDELVTTAILLMNAGHEATVHAIANAAHLLLTQMETGPSRRSALSQALENAAEAEAISEETLRYDPPLHLFTRYALEDLQLEGHHFRVGDRVGLLLGAANRDPTAFGDAAGFIPARYQGAKPDPVPVSFGAGIHFCVGAPLARLELQVALPVLFARLPDLRHAGGDVRYADRYHFHGLESLPVVW
jgi:cytochrome P450